ncbi:polysaccharide deacetylase family protein [Micromonospora carbonacea]|uniref:polysaccharide deacetylase family protein n=1 Tax=Micromonospora carbonacea TaxID=47853 RepID=UPI00180B611F|nr:polysaccharide deacetylase family protein [Micromonospora carbonacea]MBB5826467.1 peptidoglycan/xylan/chitin deacetylase (PgdA/CDA1 family) [Micromonospora carbonacea]
MTAPRGRRRCALALAGAAAVAVAAHAGPATTAVGPVRRRFLPRLDGAGPPGRIALTFDDGPDPESTPRFLDVLAAHRTRATFFVLGTMLVRSPWLAADLVAGGHEVAVHGWEHRNLLGRGPLATYRDLARTRALVEAATGRAPRFFRPPYGVLTGPALLASARLGLTPVLWTRWGRDWTAAATPDSVFDTVTARLAGGDTVLLHDADCAAAPGAWRATLAALPRLLAECRRRGWTVGPLGAHGASPPGPVPTP